MGREEDQLKDINVVEETDYFDVDPFGEDNRYEIDTILTVDQNVSEKMTFSVFCLNIIVTSFLFGFVPNYYYIWHTAQAVAVFPFRLYSYKKLKFHYFLFDFCYFTNYLTLLYIWIPSSVISDSYRGELFTLCFSSAMGPVLIAIVMWRNSLVPHSPDKMISLYVHFSSSLALWGIKWYGLPDQGFPICAGQTRPGRDGCQHVGLHQFVLNPLVFYLCWQLLYIAVVEVWRKNRVKERQYETSYKWLAEKTTEGILYKLFSMLGARYQKVMFIVWQFIYTTIAVLIGYNSFHSQSYGILLFLLVMAIACYNGASFYIDVFRQQRNTAVNPRNKLQKRQG